MKVQVLTKRGMIERNVIRFKVVGGLLDGKIIDRKCPLRGRTSFPKTLVPKNPTPFRLGKKIGEDFYEIHPTGLC